MKRIAKIAGKFVIAFAAMTIICTIVWGRVTDGLYDQTDPGLPGYLQVGNWVQSFDGHPVLTVREVVHNRDMAESDMIKEGWSNTRLWHLWWVFTGISIVVSILLSRVRWMPRRDP